MAFTTSITAGEWSKAIPGINGIMLYFKIDATKFVIANSRRGRHRVAVNDGTADVQV
jgi:hypothetical protein